MEESVPGIAAVVDDVVVGFKDPVREPVLPHEPPDQRSGLEGVSQVSQVSQVGRHITDAEDGRGARHPGRGRQTLRSCEARTARSGLERVSHVSHLSHRGCRMTDAQKPRLPRWTDRAGTNRAKCAGGRSFCRGRLAPTRKGLACLQCARLLHAALSKIRIELEATSSTPLLREFSP
jgi:hypothetical protein